MKRFLLSLITIGLTSSVLAEGTPVILSEELVPYAISNELATVSYSGDYNDLSNKPVIPSIEGLATEDYVDTEVSKVDAKLDDYAFKTNVIPAIRNPNSDYVSYTTKLDELNISMDSINKYLIQLYPTGIDMFDNTVGFLTPSITEGIGDFYGIGQFRKNSYLYRFPYIDDQNSGMFILATTNMIPDVSHFALDTNVVHGRIGTGSYRGYLVDNTIRFYDSDTSYVELGIDPYIDIKNLNNKLYINASTPGTKEPILSSNFYQYYAPTNSGFIALTQNPDGSLDIELPSNIALTKPNFNGENYITNAIGFNYKIDNYHYRYLKIPSFSSSILEDYEPTALSNYGYNDIYGSGNTPPKFDMFVDDWWNITNAFDSPGYLLHTENAYCPEVNYGILGTYFYYLDNSTGNEYYYNYLFPTNHTTKYFALTDDPNGVINIDLSSYVTYSDNTINLGDVEYNLSLFPTYSDSTINLGDEYSYDLSDYVHFYDNEWTDGNNTFDPSRTYVYYDGTGWTDGSIYVDASSIITQTELNTVSNNLQVIINTKAKNTDLTAVSNQVIEVKNSLDDYNLKTNSLVGTYNKSNNLFESDVNIKISNSYGGSIEFNDDQDGLIVSSSSSNKSLTYGSQEIFNPKLGISYIFPNKSIGGHVLATTDDLTSFVDKTITNVLSNRVITDEGRISTLENAGYATTTQLNTASNNIVAQIPDVSGYVPWIKDRWNNKTALSIGSNTSSLIGKNSVVIGSGQGGGEGSVLIGNGGATSGTGSISAGQSNYAPGIYSFAGGKCSVSGPDTNRGYDYSWVWSGDYGYNYYYSHGASTFNIRPKPVSPSTDPASGFYIGETNLIDTIKNYAPAPDLSQYVTATQVSNIVDSIIDYMVDVGGITRNGTNYVLVIQSQDLP